MGAGNHPGARKVSRIREFGGADTSCIDAETLDGPFTGRGYELPDGRLKPAASHAQRMFWASGRECTLEEDTSYSSILGLFGVNMPLIYVEGAEKAFERLQQEILKVPEEGTRLFLSRAQRFDRRRPRSSKL